MFIVQKSFDDTLSYMRLICKTSCLSADSRYEHQGFDITKRQNSYILNIFERKFNIKIQNKGLERDVLLDVASGQVLSYS